MMHWSSGYIGFPHADKGHAPSGCSCWGLIVCIYGAELGIALPTYEDRYLDLAEQQEIDNLAEEERGKPVWLRVDRPAPFDVLLFRQGRYSTHIGVVVGSSRMLHVKAGEQSKLESFDSQIWKSRLIGAYRHVEMYGRAAA